MKVIKFEISTLCSLKGKSSRTFKPVHRLKTHKFASEINEKCDKHFYRLSSIEIFIDFPLYQPRKSITFSNVPLGKEKGELLLVPL